MPGFDVAGGDQLTPCARQRSPAPPRASRPRNPDGGLPSSALGNRRRTPGVPRSRRDLARPRQCTARGERAGPTSARPGGWGSANPADSRTSNRAVINTRHAARGRAPLHAPTVGVGCARGSRSRARTPPAAESVCSAYLSAVIEPKRASTEPTRYGERAHSGTERRSLKRGRLPAYAQEQLEPPARPAQPARRPPRLITRSRRAVARGASARRRARRHASSAPRIARTSMRFARGAGHEQHAPIDDHEHTSRARDSPTNRLHVARRGAITIIVASRVMASLHHRPRSANPQQAARSAWLGGGDSVFSRARSHS